MENTKLIPLRFMARRLRVPASWLRAEALAGRISHLNAGGQLLFKPDVVEAELSTRASTPQLDKDGVAHVR